jgi:hypothetical protein
MKKYEIIIGSPIDYENLVAYIWINDEQVALVQMEEGRDKLKVEFFAEEIKTYIYFDVFMEALNEGKKELLK